MGHFFSDVCTVPLATGVKIQAICITSLKKIRAQKEGSRFLFTSTPHFKDRYLPTTPPNIN